MPRYSEFGELLSQHLNEADRPAAWLAGRMKVSRATVSRWCNGETRPQDPETVIRICDCLGVQAEQREELLRLAGYGYQAAPTDESHTVFETEEPESFGSGSDVLIEEPEERVATTQRDERRTQFRTLTERLQWLRKDFDSSHYKVAAILVSTIMLVALIALGGTRNNTSAPDVDGQVTPSPISNVAEVTPSSATSAGLGRNTIVPTQTPCPAPAAESSDSIWVNLKDCATYRFVPASALIAGITDEQFDSVVTRCLELRPDWERANCEQWYDGELPQHTVTVDEFWIMDKEVTNAQYRKCVDDGPCKSPGHQNTDWHEGKSPDHPVSSVDWYQASVYADWVDGRLPTETEWEMACRGGDERLFPWTEIEIETDEAILRDYANFKWGGTNPKVALADSGKPGAFNLYNMSGNVAEWTSTTFTDDYNFQLDTDAKTELETSEPSERRTIRGGSFASISLDIRCTSRTPYESKGENAQVPGIGFRVVRNGP